VRVVRQPLRAGGAAAAAGSGFPEDGWPGRRGRVLADVMNNGSVTTRRTIIWIIVAAVLIAAVVAAVLLSGGGSGDTGGGTGY
jgi:hypothetical protein